jgi:DNA-binding response OmpR family regulator
MDKMRILIVEDEWVAAEFLKQIVEDEGAEVVGIVDTGKEAISECIARKPDIVFMDIMLRDNVSGSEAALEISRRCDSDIVFLTAYSDPEMIDYAVESDAAGYLSKPYNETEIVATLKLIAGRRARKRRTTHLCDDKNDEEKNEEIRLKDGFVYHTQYRRLMKEGKEVKLGQKALRAIELLVRNPNVSVSDEAIMLYVWGEVVNDRTFRSLMYRIRSATSESLIENVSGVGYMIRTE